MSPAAAFGAEESVELEGFANAAAAGPGRIGALLVYAIAIGYFGVILQVPEWLNNLSPFGTPQMPADDFTALPLVILTVLAAALVP